MPETESSQKRFPLFVLGLDGVPHSFVARGIESGALPNLRRLAGRGRLMRIHSELPAVSSVAWASFITGVDPATHGIFGFVDRRADTGEIYIPTARNRRAPALWNRVSDQGRPAVAINVPGSFPADEINGCVVADFLCPTVERATPRSDVLQYLQEIEYVIDVDAALGKADDKAPFVAALHNALAKRRELALRLLDREPWDYFQLHIMETDRINHFLWDAGEDADHPLHDAFHDFYREVDALAGEMIDRVAERARWMVLSDHGFARTRFEVNLNALLRDLKFLRYMPGEMMSLEPVHPESIAFSLLPGRIYVNLAGRELNGGVPPGRYASALDEIARALEDVRLPANSEPIFADVVRARDVYGGPLLDQACDLIAVAHDGIDLRAGFRETGAPFKPASNSGIHTYGDAFVIDGGNVLTGAEAGIREVGARVAEAIL
jgi:predicted AlkP superfamily phosphohydrolase/phosphomutase